MKTLLRLAIHRMEFTSSAEKRRIEEAIADVPFFQSLSLDDVSMIIGRSLRTGRFDPDTLLAHAEEDLRVLERRAARIVFYDDAAYPRLLGEIYDPPYLLFVVGSLQDDRPRVGVVGTRSPSVDGASAAGRLGRDLAEAGVCVVSGLARGIDTLAHRGAVSGGGAHLAVLGSGIDYVYPAQNKSLAQQILDQGGAIVSEYPPGVPPTRYHFPERNRIISGTSEAVVVVQAPARSGALYTADFALDQGRELMVHAEGMRGTVGAGTAHLAEEGAPVVTDGAEVLEMMGVTVPTTPRRAAGRRFVPVVQAAAAGRQLGLELIAEMGAGESDREGGAPRGDERTEREHSG